MRGRDPAPGIPHTCGDDSSGQVAKVAGSPPPLWRHTVSKATFATSLLGSRGREDDIHRCGQPVATDWPCDDDGADPPTVHP